MVKMDKMYVNLRNLWGLSWYFIIQGLDQLRDRRLWLVSFVYPFQVSRDFPFFITFKLCIHRKDFTKILSQPKMGKQAEGGSLTRAWSVFFSPVWDNLVPRVPLLLTPLSPSLSPPPPWEREGGPRFDVEFERESHAPSNHTTPKADMLIFPFKSDFEIESLIQ